MNRAVPAISSLVDPSQTCATVCYRCLVELVAALEQRKAVAMLVGRALADGRFKTNHAMLQSLFRLVDVRHASATVPADLEREMGKIEATVGIARVNTLARGAIEGAMQAMGSPQLLAAAIGAGPNLMAVAPLRRRNDVLAMASAAGFEGPVRALLLAGASVQARDRPWQRDGPTALMLSARGGHCRVANLLLDAGTDVMARDRHGWSALRFAANGGHLEMVKLLVAAGAEDVASEKGWLPKDGEAEWDAAEGGHEDIAAVLRMVRKRKEQ